MLLIKIRPLLLTLLFTGVCATVTARSVGHPDIVALGGGTAYLSGIDAHFHNPANLALHKRSGRFQISAGSGGVYDSRGERISSWSHFPDIVSRHFYSGTTPGNEFWSDDDVTSLFSNDDRLRHTRKYEFTPVAISWSGGNSARSVALRSRGMSSFQISRNWFDAANASESGEEESLSRRLSEQYHVYHELSVGFAREVTMFNNWTADLNTLYFGIAPKFILGGMHSDSEFESRYIRSDNEWDNSKHLTAHVAGDIDRFVSELIAGADPHQTHREHFSRSSNMEVNGIGMGLDAGLTYVMPLGDDIALSPHVDRPLRKSLRFSIAVHDLGAVRYHNHDGTRESRTITRTYEDIPESDAGFSGYPAELFHYLAKDEAEQSVFENLADVDESAYYVQLPTKLHLGAAIQYNWFVGLIDLNYRFNAPEFETDGWITSLGSEIRILPFLPVKGSMQIRPDGSISFGAGLGLDAGPVSASGAVRLHRNSDSGKTNWVAGSVSGMSLRISF